jgi:hypothetical protein
MQAKEKTPLLGFSLKWDKEETMRASSLLPSFLKSSLQPS